MTRSGSFGPLKVTRGFSGDSAVFKNLIASPSNSLDSMDSSFSTPVSAEKMESRMLKMKERYQRLQALSEEEMNEDQDMYNQTLSGTVDLSPASLVKNNDTSPPRTPVWRSADTKWKAVKKTVMPVHVSDIVNQVKGSKSVVPSRIATSHVPVTRDLVKEDSEVDLGDIDSSVFFEYWRDVSATVPAPNDFTLETTHPLDTAEIRLGESTGAAEYLQEFEVTSSAELLELFRIPEEEVQRKREELEVIYAHEQRLAAEARIKEEAELVWREHGTHELMMMSSNVH
jgi:hypothetical protein